MVWTAYQVTFQLLSPMHIGWRRVGNLQQTRPYVIGRNLWGALTERLVRNKKGESNYIATGKQVDEQLAFSYFYPSAACDMVTLWPWGDTWDEFAWVFLDSYASTALEQAQGRSAAEGSLHETEYIAPYTRALSAHSIAAGAPVYLTGYIFAREGCSLAWREALKQLQLGGERGYGWGRLSLKRCQEVLDRSFFGLYELDCTGDRPLLTATGGVASTGQGGSTGADDLPLLAHVDTAGQAAPTDSDGRPWISGQIEPLVGRETTITGEFGKGCLLAGICWTPGSRVRKGRKFRIENRGIWLIHGHGSSTRDKPDQS